MINILANPAFKNEVDDDEKVDYEYWNEIIYFS